MRLGLSGAKALPEDSIPLRIVVALAVEVGLFAVISQGVVADRTAFLALALAPAGYALSYRRRGRPNVLLKVALAAGLLLALSRFLGQMGSVTSADAARAPLAALFVWVQVLHAFDVPRRRDLAFSMVSSTTLIAVGGALALTSSYLGILLGWAALAGAWLWLSSRPLAGDLTVPLAQVRDRSGSRGRVAAGRSLVLATVAALVLAVAMFSVLPRIPATMVRALPFRMPAGAAAGPQGDHVQNPALPPQSSDGSVVDFSSNGYPGFSDVMDLRARGTLSDDIVFRVRAPFALVVACRGVRHLRRLDLDALDLAADPPRFERQWRLRRARPDRVDGRRELAGADLLHRADAAKRVVRGGDSVHGLFPCRRAPQRPRRVHQIPDLPRSRVGLLGGIHHPDRDAGTAAIARPDVPDAHAGALPAVAAATRDPAAAGPRPGRSDHGRRAERIRRRHGRPGVAPDEHALRPDRAAGAGGRRRGGSIPVRHAPWIL